MALYKEIENEGFICNYHRICGVISAWNNNESIAILINSYMNDSMRGIEKEELKKEMPEPQLKCVKEFQIHVPTTNDWSLENLYELLKQTEEFKDAIDC